MSDKEHGPNYDHRDRVLDLCIAVVCLVMLCILVSLWLAAMYDVLPLR